MVSKKAGAEHAQSSGDLRRSEFLLVFTVDSLKMPYVLISAFGSFPPKRSLHWERWTHQSSELPGLMVLDATKGWEVGAGRRGWDQSPHESWFTFCLFDCFPTRRD